jgi:hypothetical protein
MEEGLVREGAYVGRSAGKARRGDSLVVLRHAV